MSYELDEIKRAIGALGLSDSEFRKMPDPESQQILLDIEAHFVGRPGLRWWWEAFRRQGFTVRFNDQKAFLRLHEVIPSPSDSVWFVVESEPHFLLFEGSVSAVQRVIGECFAFEYYLVGQDLGWLVCENHHDAFIAVGDPVEGRLRSLAAAKAGEIDMREPDAPVV